MENASKALVMAAVVIITVLLLTIFVYSNRKAADFAETQNSMENFYEVQKFNTPFNDLFLKANVDYSGSQMQKEIGATIEDVVSTANYANYINSNTPYNVNIELITRIKGKNKKYTNEDFKDPKKVELIIKNDLELREDLDINDPKDRIRYKCKLEFNNPNDSGRVTDVFVEVKKK